MLDMKINCLKKGGIFVKKGRTVGVPSTSSPPANAPEWAVHNMSSFM